MTEYEVDITFTTPGTLTRATRVDLRRDTERFSALDLNTYRLATTATSAYAGSAIVAVECRIARVLHLAGIPEYEAIKVSARKITQGEQG